MNEVRSGRVSFRLVWFLVRSESSVASLELLSTFSALECRDLLLSRVYLA